MLNVAWCSRGPPAVNLKHTESLCVCADCVEKSPATVLCVTLGMTLETNRDCSGGEEWLFLYSWKVLILVRIMKQRLSRNLKAQFTLKVKKTNSFLPARLLLLWFFHLIGSLRAHANMNQSLEANCTSNRKKKKKKACQFALCVIVCAMVSTYGLSAGPVPVSQRTRWLCALHLAAFVMEQSEQLPKQWK